MKYMLAAGLFMMASICLAQTPPAEAEAKPEAAAPTPAAARVTATDAILMSDVVPYAEGSKIPVEVLQECTALGRQLADSTEKYGKENGVSLVRAAAVDPAKGGQVLVLRIVSVLSA